MEPGFQEIEATLKKAAHLIHRPKGIEVDDEVIARGDSLSVLSMEMRVMALEDVFVTKLIALSEHALRFEGVLQMARSLREQVDWERVRRHTVSSPFARAFFTMAEGLDVVPESGGQRPVAGRPRVTVLEPLRSAGHEAG